MKNWNQFRKWLKANESLLAVLIILFAEIAKVYIDWIKH